MISSQSRSQAFPGSSFWLLAKILHAIKNWSQGKAWKRGDPRMLASEEEFHFWGWGPIALRWRVSYPRKRNNCSRFTPTTVQLVAVLQATKAWNSEKFLRRRSPYINGHTHPEGQRYIFAWCFMNQVNDSSNSLYCKQLLQWLVEGVM